MAKRSSSLAKLTRPRLYDALPRERLFKLLDRKRKHPAIWVDGPPGAGKTVLMASYWEARRLNGIWYHVDGGDSDISTFFYHLTESAKPLAPRKQPLPLLTPEYLIDVESFARRYFRELFSRMEPDSLLVLDNFQFVADRGALPKALSIALSEVPSHCNAVFISRSEPSAEFSRAVAVEALVSLGAEHLRLTVEEARALAASRGVDPALAQALNERSEGWAAGLTLTMERLRRGQATHDAVGTATNEATFDYFATQIFDTVGAEAQKTLLESSIFTAFTLELAERISGNPDAEELFDRLCRSQLFTYRRGEQDARFQYHDLFRQFLTRRLHESRTPDAITALKRTGGELLREKGAYEAAFALFSEARAWDMAAEIVRSHAPDLLAQGRGRTLQDWIETFPDDVVQADPWLLYWLGAARIYQGEIAARPVFEQAYESFKRNGDDLGQLLSAAWVVRAHYMEYSNFQPVDRWAEEMARLIAGSVQFPNISHEVHVLGALMIVFTYRQLAHPKAGTVIERLTAILDADIDPNLRIGAATGLMIYHTLAMEPVKARAIVDLMDPLLNRPEVMPLTLSWWWMFVGYQYHRAGDRQLTEKALESSDQIAAAHGLKQTHFFSHCFRTYYAVAWREYSMARAAVSALVGTFSESQPMYMAQFHLASCFLTVSTGDRESAARHAKIAVESATKLGAPFFYVAWRPQCAPAVALAGEFELAETWLDEAWAASEGTFMARYRPSILQARAYCSMLAGNREAARGFLKESLETGKTFNAWPYARGIVPMVDWMVREALEMGIERNYIQYFIRKYSVPPPAEEIENWPWPVKVRTLGEFRVEVDDQLLSFSRKAPKKPLALLKAIISFGGRHVSEQRLIDALWPDEEGDAAREAFAVNLHRLRKLLIYPDAVHLIDGAISLDAQSVWVDAWTFERQVQEWHRSKDLGPSLDKLLSLYRGHFLLEETETPWAVSMRERLRGQFLRCLSAAAHLLEEAGNMEGAAQLYRRGIETDDLIEEFYQGLMRCLVRQNRKAEAMAVFRRLRQVLSVTLGISPSTQSEALFRSLQQQD